LHGKNKLKIAVISKHGLVQFFNIALTSATSAWKAQVQFSTAWLR